MTTQARAEYFEAERLGVITLPTGAEMRVRNVTYERFQQLVFKHDAKFSRGVPTNCFTR